MAHQLQIFFRVKTAIGPPAQRRHGDYATPVGITDGAGFHWALGGAATL
jgi:hypothetical protein